MIKIDCPKLVKKSLIPAIALLVLIPSAVFASTDSTINFQGKIVRNDTGYEGLNVTAGSPACVVDGNGNDTCDFQVKYYTAASGGTLLLTESFANVEIGQYNGAFTLSLGSDGSPVAGTYASCEGGTCDNLQEVVNAVTSLYVQVGFSPAGNGSYTETFSRMPIQAAAYALKAKYAEAANTAFQFDTAANSSGYATPSAGMVYYDTTDTTLKVYDGSAWNNVGGSGTGTGSLFTDSGAFTFLTSLTDHFVLGSNSYTEIGADSYSTYLAGLATRAPLSFDMTAERLTLSGSQAQSGLTVYSDYSGSSAWPVVSFKAEDSAFDNVVLQVSQDGTGNIMSLLKGSTEAFVFENPLTFYIHPRTTDPTVYANRLYNVNGTLYWNGNVLGTGSSLWTDAGTYSYLTSTTDDLILGGDSASNAKFFFDVSTGNLGIGTSTPGAKLDIAGSSSTISNTTGDITISPDDTVVIKANDTQADNLMEWQNSTGTVLGLINQNGYATLGSSSSNTSAILTLGASSSSVAQIHLTSGFDVSAPTSGDLWWNGTGLYFYDGSTSVDLLTSGGGGSDVLSSYGSAATGGYVNLEHDTNSYDVVASGWICVGGTDSESCSGGNWKNIKDSDLTVTQNLSNQWNNADTDGIIRSIIKLTDVELAPGINVGTGGDGDITVSANSDINSEDMISDRACADGGDAVNYNVTSFNAAGTEATLSVTPSYSAENPNTSCLYPGDEVLIINLQGTSAAYGNVGNYETLRIASISGSTITFETAKTKYYGSNVTDDTNLGVTTNTQRVMLQRVPNYNDVTVDVGFSLYPSDWDGAKGGVLFFRASGVVSINGSVYADSFGYRGGASGAGILAGGIGGEAFCAPNTEDVSAGGTGGAAIPNEAGGNGLCGGGGGSGANDAIYGGIGYGTSNLGGAGGGGGGAEDSTTDVEGYAGGGGGGGYGGAGLGGSGSTGAAAGIDGGSNQSGNGGLGAAFNTNTYGGNGGGGGTYGTSDLSKLMFGSGGGAGGDGEANATVSYEAVAAGDGGGIIYMSADNITISGVVHSNGGTGGTGPTSAGGSGGGAGGSIKIQGNTVVLGTGVVTASGGTGGVGGNGNPGDGGTGGVGRIAVYYGTSVTGTTTPTYSGTNVGYYSYGVYVSDVIDTTNAQSYDNLKWESDLNTYGKISVQTRSGSSSDSSDGTWEGWKPYTSGTNYSVLQSMDDYTQWTGTNATVAIGDVTRPYTAAYGFEDEYENTGTNLTKVTSSTNGGYMESTITAANLSTYDYVTLWVRASQAGNTIRIGMGESAGTEQYEDITIDVANTWQKVYWDISDISSTSRDAITKLRITNFSTTSNTIYVDNIRGEDLLTTSTGSNIASTPNSYFQYRVIFTTTNLSYQPMLNNISFTYGTGYRIVMYDSNNVRLYNYTNSTKYLRLEVVASTGSTGSGGGFVNGLAVSHVEDGAGAIAFQFNTSSTYSNPTSKLLSVMNNSSEKMYLDSNGNLYVSGTITSGAGLSSALINNSGSTITSKSLVTLDSSVDNAFTTTTIEGAQGAFGVVQGTEINGDVDGDGNCDDGDTCLVTFEGVTNVYLDNASTAVKGEYVYSSTTAGKGHADSEAAQTNGLIGIISSTVNSASGYVQIVFDAQNKVTANLYLNVGFDKNAYRDMYLQLAEDYTNMSLAERRGVIESNQSETIMFDNLVDGLKVDSANSTVGLDYYNQKTGLWGGLALTDSTTDIAANRFFGVSGASLVNTSYYYDRTQTGKVGQDSTIATQIDSGIDPFWYKGVSYVTSCTSGCASTTNLSESYNGALFDVAGSYASGSEHGYINITVASLTLTGITADITSADSSCSVTGATLTFDQAYSFTAGSCSGGNITITPKRYLYTTGDVFKVASWYVEPTTADDRGSTRDFPQRSIILTTKTSSNIYTSIIDYDTQKVWMKFNSNSAIVASANFLVNNADYSFTKTYMRNGNMYFDFSTMSSNADAVVAGFARDDAWALDGSTWYKYESYLANRNAGSGYTALTNPYTFSSGDGSGASYIGLDYPAFASSTIKGIDSNAEGTSGTYYSNTVTFQENSDKAYLWVNGYIDSLDTSGSITVYASNDNGGNYVAGTLLHTDTSNTIPEYEYSFDFSSTGNMYKVKFVMTREASKKSSTYITKWGLAQMDVGQTDVNGLFTQESDTVTNGSYIEVIHGQNTYNLVASGWVFDTTLSKWVEVTNTDNGITQNLSNQWNNASTSGIIRSVIKQTDVELAPSMNIGTGTDGDVTFTTGTNVLDTTRFISGRSVSCPDAIAYNVVSFNSTGTQATLSSNPNSSCIVAGDEVLIINLQGTVSSAVNLGNYETLRVSSLDVANSQINFTTSKTRYYGDGASNDSNIGTDVSNQRVVLQRVPNYKSVTVSSGATLTATAWNGTYGGVLFFRATGTVAVGGTVTTVGYRAGTGGSTFYVGGTAGESFCGNPGGGIGGSQATSETGGSATCGGGGGAGTSGGVSYTGGAGTATTGGAGGGGGSAYWASSGSTGYGGGGGGGGSAGNAGMGGVAGYSSTYSGGNGASNSSGNGGNSSGAKTGGSGGGGGGGGSYNATDTSLTKLQLGSGGGGGGGGANYGSTGSGGNGGLGGGIIYIAADTITVSGSLSVAGAAGSAGTTTGGVPGGGGGGGGGALKLAANNFTLGTGLVKASGGAGNTAYSSYGGNGGDGIIAISYKLTSTITGTTTPTYNGTNVGYYGYGVYISPVISTTNAQAYDNLKWESTLNTYGKISVQTRSGSTSDPTDGTWEGWKPYTSGTNYTTLQGMDDYTQWTGTNATVAVGDVTRPYTAVYGFEDEYENTGTNLTKVTSSTNGGYMESTITSTDLSTYDYVTLWVRASQAGNTIRIGMGESAGTEQYEDITIDVANTWQKVYWDISDISSTSRDAITKLRVTNFSTTSNTIYIDNIRGEDLLTTSTGSNIASTPNSYFQYRVIFTTTNLSYQPMLNNITLVYSTGFKIQIVDANTVRLYNNSGQTQKLRLDVILGSAAIDLTSSQYSLNLAPTSAQIDGGDNTNSIWINKLGTGGNLLKLQTASSDMLVVDSSGNMTLAGDVSISGGSIDLGSEGATIRYNSTSNTIEFSNDGLTWLALGDIARQVVLSAEYPGAVLSGDGTDNTGTMVSDNTGSSSNSMNYYEWSSSAVSLNDYDVRVRFTLPSDFSGWGSTGGVTLNLATESTSSSNNKVDMYIYKEGSATIDGTSEGNASSSAGVWKTTTIAGTDLNECATAGDTCVFILRMSSMNDNYVRVGDIEITYNRSL